MKPCEKHPKYKANKKPSHECCGCLSYYLSKKGTRKPIAPPSKPMKSIKDYSRKTKHKKSLED